MINIGGFMILMGAGSFILNMMGLQFTLLAWIDMWGPTIGIAIRIGLIVLGAILVFMGMKGDGGEEDEA